MKLPTRPRSRLGAHLARLAGLCLCLLLAPGAWAESTQVFTLSNGMALWVKPDRRAPTVVHMVWLRTGSMDEVDGQSGVAHVLEHMLFKGTQSLKPGEFSRRIAAMGGQDNAFTSRDATAYHQQVPAQRLEEVMRLEADRFANNRWEDAEFLREIEVIKEERRQRVEDVPRARMFEALTASAFVAHPYRRPIVGWMSDLDSMTPEDVRHFYQRWYRPANALVVVVGDVDPQQVLRLAERHYGAIPAQPLVPRKPQEEPEQHGPRRLVYRAATEQAVVVKAYRVPQLRQLPVQTEQDRDALALTVLAALLDGHSAARLERALVQSQARLADAVGASYGLMGRGPQQFVLSAIPAQGVAPEAVQAALRAELRRLATEGVEAAELQRVKTQWTASEVYKLDSLFNQARELGSHWINGLGPDAGLELIKALRAVSAEQVRSVAERYFQEDQLSEAVLLPDPSKRQAPRARPALTGAGRH